MTEAERARIAEAERGWAATVALAEMTGGQPWREATLRIVLVVAFWAAATSRLPAEHDDEFIELFSALLRNCLQSVRAQEPGA